METVFAGRIDSLELPYAVVTLPDGRAVRLSLAQEPPPANLLPGARVYVEGVFSGDLVIVRRIAVI